MHFKRLELSGFKSFVDRTVLEFEPGITAVVGPNGCGKSNIADSIRWAFGEQSPKVLRGNRMEDVIFGGTAQRPSVGMAEVSLTMEDSGEKLPLGYNEVTVTRRLFRSGESQYLINRVPCRLRDVRDLFMDTGIGRNAYSMIEQGKIDQVLSSKPEERRGIFEEAAGITKFKARKKEAIRKLEATEENLVRIQDIMEEVGRQIRSVKRQAGKARRYKELRAHLRGLEIRILLWNQRGLHEEIGGLEGEVGELRTERGRLREEAERSEERVASIQARIEQTEELLNRKQARRTELEGDLRTAKSVRDLNRERIDELKVRIEETGRERDLLSGRLESGRAAIEGWKARLDTLDERLKGDQSHLERKRGELTRVEAESAGVESDLDRDRTALVQLRSEIAASRSEGAVLEARKREATLRRQRMKVRLSELGEESDTWRSRVEEARLRLREKRESLSLREEEEEGKRLLLSSLREKLRSVQSEIEASLETLSRKEARLSFLEARQMGHGGYSEGARELLSAAEQGLVGGVLGTVGQIVKPRDGLCRAVETALGERIHAVVVESREDALRALDYLRTAGASATLIPLDTPVGEEEGRIPDSLLRSEDVVGPAPEAVQVPPSYGGLSGGLLRRVMVVKDLACALRLAAAARGRCDLVTLEGEALWRDGSVSGGRPPAVEDSLLSREDEIRRLREERADLRGRGERAQSERTSLGERIALEEAGLGESHRLRQEAEIATAIGRNDLARAESRAGNLKEDLESLSGEMDELTRLLEDTDERVAVLLSEVEEKESSSREVEASLNSLQERTAALIRARSDLTGAVHALDLGCTRLEEERSSLERRLREGTARLGEEEDLFLLRRRQVEAAAEKIRELEREIVDLGGKGEGASKALASLAEEIERLGEEGGDLRGKRGREEASRREMLDSVGEVSEKLQETEIRLATLKAQMEALVGRIREEYGEEVSEATEEESGEFDLAAASEERDRLRERIGSMGEVNLAAMEQFEELESRYNLLDSQRNDLLKAKEDLFKAIDKINRTTRELFLETFGQIRENFRVIFRRLFGGGKADLIFSDSSDVLETGIDIIAQPPGKRLQSISLLSGGERALTAVGLLFSIFRVKPSPFCVLDEIDAPLDEANIDRFISILKEFVRDSQFIIVTHNKRTIGISDVMYGITMEESGVSKVVSVRFGKKDSSPKRGKEPSVAKAS